MKLIAQSIERYNGGVKIKRLYGSSTVTKFIVCRPEDRDNPSAWQKIAGFGPTPGDRKTDAMRKFKL